MATCRTSALLVPLRTVAVLVWKLCALPVIVTTPQSASAKKRKWNRVLTCSSLSGHSPERPCNCVLRCNLRRAETVKVKGEDNKQHKACGRKEVGPNGRDVSKGNRPLEPEHTRSVSFVLPIAAVRAIIQNGGFLAHSRTEEPAGEAWNCSANEIIQETDAALYAAKKVGRNCVRMAVRKARRCAKPRRRKKSRCRDPNGRTVGI